MFIGLQNAPSAEVGARVETASETRTEEKGAALNVAAEATSPENAKARVKAQATQTVPTAEEAEAVAEEIENDPRTAETITGDTPAPAVAVPRDEEATLQKVLIDIEVEEEAESAEEAEAIHSHADAETANLQLETVLAILLRGKGTELEDLVQDHAHLAAGLAVGTKETGEVLHQEQTRE